MSKEIQLKPEWKGREAAFLRRADALMKQHGLDGWGLCDLSMVMPNVAGLCQIDECRLWFAVKRLSRQRVWMQQETILHEIAHALCRNGLHDIKWANKAKDIGVSTGMILMDLMVASRHDAPAENRRVAGTAYEIWLRGVSQ